MAPKHIPANHGRFSRPLREACALLPIPGALGGWSRQGAVDLPFSLDGLETAEIDGEAVFLPAKSHNVFLNYELGMHCVGFDMSYCCIIPPYNSRRS